jgi:hypothetical protein
MPAEKIKLLTLILSYDEGHHKEIQTKGQDATFIKEAIQTSKVFRYVGRSFKLPIKYKLIFAIRRVQYALLDYSKYSFIGAMLRLIVNSRFADRAIRSIPKFSGASTNVDCIEVKNINEPVPKLVTESPEDWSLIGLKTILAFRYLLDNYEFDYVFRTNTSSYLDVPTLLEYLAMKPRKNMYAGVIGNVFVNTRFASGAGILLSRDLVRRISDNSELWKHGLVDDVAIAELIASFQDPSVILSELPRLDFASLEEAKSTKAEIIKSNFHFRCKTDSADETIDIMKYIYEVKNPAR